MSENKPKLLKISKPCLNMKHLNLKQKFKRWSSINFLKYLFVLIFIFKIFKYLYSNIKILTKTNKRSKKYYLKREKKKDKYILKYNILKQVYIYN